MPEHPHPKARTPVHGPPPPTPAVAYAELHCKTNFSFLEGASHPDELVRRAVELGYRALAITDRHSLAGVVRAHAAAKESGLHLLIGAEIAPLDAPPLVLLATDRAAYGRLARLITQGRRCAPKGKCHVTFDDVARHAAGLLAGVVISGCEPGRAVAPGPGGKPGGLVAALGAYRELFSDRCYALAELHAGAADDLALVRWHAAGQAARVPLVAANDVHFHDRARQPVHDLLTAVRLGCTIEQAAAAGRLFANAGRHLTPAAALCARFAPFAEWVAHTVEAADRCRFSLEELRYEYPEELCPPGTTPREFLTRLTWAGAAERYGAHLPEKVRNLIVHELNLIADLRYEAYFLTVWDVVQFARGRGILCQGRGSAANSAVCYCLGVTSVDPEKIDVLFERFISRERDEAPDIDVDFEHERREEVLQYLFEKYGRERVAMTAEIITYRPRSAVRDAGRALGLSRDCVDRLAKSVGAHGGADQLPQALRAGGLDPASALGRRLLGLVCELLGFPRHLSQHVGGMVMTRGPLCEIVPIENAAMPGRTVIQWDKDDLDVLGILKVDCLALGMLTAIHRSFDLIQQLPAWPGGPARPHTLAEVPREDPQVYEMLRRADTMGVFQIESRAQMSMLPRLQPRSFYDLVIEVAIVRPGPIQGNMVHPYLRRRAGLEDVAYPSAAVRHVLEKTLGVPIFQEQAMRLAVVAAGFTPGEADQLRRAMGAWRRPGLMEQFGRKLISGMQARGYSTEFAQQVFDQICGFGEYGFPESHAASFAWLVYVSAWLKRHYPAAFTAALLNSQPMGFYAPAQLVRDLRAHGGEIRPVDLNCSDWDCTLEPAPRCAGGALRLGFRMLAGFSAVQARRLVEVRRASGLFQSPADLARRTGLGRHVLSQLAQGDAFGSLQLSRRAALWETLASEPARLQAVPETGRQLTLGFETTPDEPAPPLRPMPLAHQVAADYRTLGLSLRGHPLQFLRAALSERRVIPSLELPRVRVGRVVRVAGLVLLRQKPSTAKGVIFMTLEDETGTANLIVRPEIWARYRPAASAAVALLAHGRIERQGVVIHILVNRLEDISGWLRGLRPPSRDFR